MSRKQSKLINNYQLLRRLKRSLRRKLRIKRFWGSKVRWRRKRISYITRIRKNFIIRLIFRISGHRPWKLMKRGWRRWGNRRRGTLKIFQIFRRLRRKQIRMPNMRRHRKCNLYDTWKTNNSSLILSKLLDKSAKTINK